MRRPMWLAAGAALGAGGTVWARRRIDRLSRRMRPGSVGTELASMVDRTRRGATDRVRDALSTGRADALRRQDELWHQLSARQQAPR